jgi:hypothetical protein
VSGTVTTAATGSIICTDSPFKSTLSQDKLYEGKFLFIPTATASGDRSRVVASYTASTGIFVPDNPWSVAPTGLVFEIHGHPIEPQVELLAIINDALTRCMVPVEFSFSPSNTSNVRHSLASAASWLTDPRWIYQVGVLGPNDTRAYTDPYSRIVYGVAEKDGATVYLNLYPRKFATTDVIYVRAAKPAYFHCSASGGSYGSQSGLSAETDIASVDEYWLAQAAKLVVLDRYDTMGAAADQAAFNRERQMTALRFTDLTRQNFEPWPRTFRPLARLSMYSGAGFSLRNIGGR